VLAATSAQGHQETADRVSAAAGSPQKADALASAYRADTIEPCAGVEETIRAEEGQVTPVRHWQRDCPCLI
jgi:hypothetical protein